MLCPSGIGQTISQGLWRRTTTPPILLPGTILHCTLSNMELPCALFLCWFHFLYLLSNCYSYVKWLEAAGAQVVPVIISIDDNEDLTEYFKEVIIVLN